MIDWIKKRFERKRFSEQDRKALALNQSFDSGISARDLFDAVYARGKHHGGPMSGLDEILGINWLSSPNITPEADYRTYSAEVLAAARKLHYNCDVINSFMENLSVGVIGDNGFVAVSEDDKMLDLVEEMSDSDNFCVDGKTTRAQFELLAFVNLIRDGEIFIRVHRNYDNDIGVAFELIDPAYIATLLPGHPKAQSRGNQIRLGIEYDGYKPVAYYLKSDPLDWDTRFTYDGRTDKGVIVDAKDMFHFTLNKFPGLRRGYSSFLPVIIELENMARLNQSTLETARKISKIMLAFKSDVSNMNIGQTYARPGTGKDPITRTTPVNSKVISIDSSGANEIGREGEVSVLKNDGMNGASYDAFMTSHLRRAAAGLAMPDHIMNNNYHGMSYSATLAGNSVYELRNRRIRENLSAMPRWCFRQVLTHQHKQMGARRIKDMLRTVSWNGYVAPPIDPEKFAQANKILIEIGIKSQETACREWGGDWENESEKIAKEAKVRMEQQEAQMQMMQKYAPKDNPGGDNPADNKIKKNNKKGQDG